MQCSEIGNCRFHLLKSLHYPKDTNKNVWNEQKITGRPTFQNFCLWTKLVLPQMDQMVGTIDGSKMGDIVVIAWPTRGRRNRDLCGHYWRYHGWSLKSPSLYKHVCRCLHGPSQWTPSTLVQKPEDRIRAITSKEIQKLISYFKKRFIHLLLNSLSNILKRFNFVIS